MHAPLTRSIVSRVLLALSLAPAALALLACETKSGPDLIPWGDPDLDGDGFSSSDGDCDDFDITVNPGADEVCDGVDNNCDEVIDEGAVDATTWHIDYDGDTYGGISEFDTVSCEQPEGYVADGSDCDDLDAAVNPEADEVCDGVDNNCDGILDEDAVGGDATWYIDGDGDGYGSEDYTLEQCTQPEGYALEAGDCDDQEAEINPGAVEVCNTLDDNCDGAIDEGVIETFYLDDDGDGYGVEGDSAVAEGCEPPAGYALSAGAFDCDDGNPLVYPGADELCDGLDDDCDETTVDEGRASWIADGVWADWTEALAGGSEGAPAALRLGDDGELRFCDGTWYVNLEIDGAIVDVTSLNGAASTTLDGAGVDSVITVQGGGYLGLEGLQLRGGEAAQGGAIYLSYASASVVDALLVDNTATDDGGAVYVSSSTLSVSGAEISNNEAAHNGGGLYIYGESELALDSLMLINNLAGQDGGGFYAYAFSAISAVDSTISNNAAVEDGAGLVLGYSSTLALERCALAENDAGDDGGGAYLFGYSELAGTDTEIDGNSAAGRGGGLYLSDSSAELTDGNLSINDGDQGGGAYVDDAGVLAVTRSFVGENSPEDVRVAAAVDDAYDWGGTASFSCDDAGCETVESPDGGDTGLDTGASADTGADTGGAR